MNNPRTKRKTLLSVPYNYKTYFETYKPFCFWHLELRAHSQEQIVQNIMILTTAANHKVYYKEVHILRAVRF